MLRAMLVSLTERRFFLDGRQRPRLLQVDQRHSRNARFRAEQLRSLLGSWFETRENALLTMRSAISTRGLRPHPEEPRSGVSKDEETQVAREPCSRGEISPARSS